MSSTNGAAGIPPEVASVVRRYHRVERAVSWLVALVVVAVVLTAIRTLDLLPAALVAIGVVALVRVPIVSRSGRTRLVADADPSAVVAAFRSATPPILAFQWAAADEIDSGGEGRNGVGGADGDADAAPTTRATYDLSYLFGLRSVSMNLEVRSVGVDDAGAVTDGDEAVTDGDAVETLEVSATAGGRPWGTYHVSIRESDAGTVVDVALTTDRRFDLRSVPQALVAERYFDRVLSAQGYRVADRSVSWST
ncbi:hypothetical protein [Halorubrum cibi]|uniref:Uncharacterized protein n=1 Tax=Halorubrum cibi TaxID=413815 RepID=A0A521CKP2_9EURY|nr:hypothetical protein [Halorubrum cibi]SMO60006.1 hypothetical protein SAMN06264867_104279 [Halorubrum cibi]